MRTHPANWLRLFLLVHLLGGGALVWGQVTGGTFTGVVKDQSGAVIPDAKIVLKGVTTGAETIVGTSSEGVFTVPFLTAGDYVITAEKVSFTRQVFGPVTLPVNQTVRVDFTLTVGRVSESVEVRASGAQLLESETGGISQVITDEQMSQMPLNGRNYQQLIALSPGTVDGSPGETGSPNPYNINGQRSKSNNYFIDGVSTLTGEAHNNQIIPPLDAIQEFSVSTNSFSAQYGNAAGGIVNLQLRSGTNRWHGAVSEYFRNDKLNANNFFANATDQPRGALRYNQYGGSAGGPIRRNKTFLFVAYQGSRSISPGTVIATVPLVPQRNGDFSGYKSATGALIPIYDPSTPNLPGQTYADRAPFPLNVMPVSAMDPSARLLLNAFPLPNLRDAGGNVPTTNNWAGSNTSDSTINSYSARFDHSFSDRNKLFARVTAFNSHSDTPATYGPLVGGTFTGAGQGRNLNTNIGVGDTYIFQPTLINEFRVGLSRWVGGKLSFLDGQNTAADMFHIPGVNINSDTTGLPTFNVTGYWYEGDSTNTPNHPYDTNESYSDTLAWVRGRQTIRIGAEAAWDQLNYTILTAGKGRYTYSANMTSDLVKAVNAGKAAGNAVASFLTGYHSTFVKDELAGEVGLRFPRYAFFLQDDWKASDRLTLNLGVRYDVMPPYHEVHDHLADFDLATKTMTVAGGNNGRDLRNTDYGNIEPRVGMALALTNDRKTLLRAGYGISFVNILNSTTDSKMLSLNIPFYYSTSQSVYNYGLPTYRLSVGQPPLAIPPATNPDGNVFYEDPNGRNSYSQNWTLGIQRAITGTMMVEVAYIGTKGTRLFLPVNINAAGPGTTAATTRRPISNVLGTVNYYADEANSSYHGLQVRFQKRFTNGFSLLGHWTWSKSLDNQSTGIDGANAGGVQPQNFNNLAAERGLSTFDRTHRVVVNFIWEVPYGRGKRFGASANGVLNFVLGGWQASGILTAQSGAPFSVLEACGDFNADGDDCRPNRVASGVLPDGERSLQEWFNPSAFVKVPASAKAYGNAGRDILRAPGLWNTDMGIAKYFFWSGRDETRRIQFRAEMFNALNHTNWGMPGNSIDSPTAMGVITSAGAARQVQFALRFEF